jgi:putative molybdopterin biosynthesis protein
VDPSNASQPAATRRPQLLVNPPFRPGAIVEPLVNPTAPEALTAWFALLRGAGALSPTSIEETPLDGAQGLVLALHVRAVQAVPPFRVAAMDAFAVRAANISRNPTRLDRARFAAIDNGEAVAEEWDSVVPIEETSPDAQGILVRAAVVAGQHVRPVGEDILAGAVVVQAGARLGPYELALAAACGHGSVRVRARPRVAILPTGEELRPPGERLGPGEATESNGVMLAALTRNTGADPILPPTQPDDPGGLETAICSAAEGTNLLLVLSGSSRGTRDHTANVLAKAGNVAVRGVALRPGHPVILGHVASTPVIGMPGYPVSAAQAFGRFATPLLERLTLTTATTEAAMQVELAASIHGRRDAEVMVPVRLERRVGTIPLAYPLSRKGAALQAFGTADAVLHVPAGISFDAGALFEAERRPGE